VLSFTASIKVQAPSTGALTEQFLADIGEREPQWFPASVNAR
jgi:hypothetical protein